MYAYSGILAALFERKTTGVGASLEVSMLESLGEWMGYPYYYTVYGGEQPPRAGASHATIAPYGPFTAADGITLNLGLQNEREWKSFCDHFLRQPELVDDPRFCGNADRVAHREELDSLIRAAFADLSSSQAAERLEQAKIAWATQRNVLDFASHPQLLARDRVRSVETPVGPVDALRPPVTVEGREQPMGAVPGLGQHTDEILDWLKNRTPQLTSDRK